MFPTPWPARREEHNAGAARAAYSVMDCEKVAEVAQMRDDDLEDA